MGDRPITAFNSNKSRALLIYLAVTQQTFTRAALAGFFWGDMPEDKAQTNLRKSIANLRQLVDDYLIVTRHTLAFNSATDFWIDCAEIAALVDRHTGRAPSPADAQEALELYRGDFLEGFHLRDTLEFEQWVLGQRAAWRDRMFPVFDTVIDHYIRIGQYKDAIDYGLRLLQIEPWREEVCRTLMLLYGRLGQRSTALNQYQQCRLALEAELGVEPAPETVALMRRIRYAPAPNHNLPAPHARLLGRSEELSQLEALCHDPHCRLITLTGAGGMGKTRLALAAAEKWRTRYLEGAWFVDLSSVVEPRDLPLAIVSALNFKATATESLTTQLVTFLRGKEMLLVLDNFEQLADQTQLLAAVLARAPGVHLIVTSRKQLGLKEERVVVVEGLPIAEAAVDLFGRTVAQFRPNFDHAANLPAITAICTLVQGSPLAIELAAAAARTYPCDYIADAIRRNLDLLQTTMHDVHPRHRSVRAVFEHSWQALTPGEQAAFARLSVLRGSFTLPAARQICELEAHDLAQLVNHSLIRRLPSDRYECHELLRQYAFEALSADTQLQDRTARRHMQAYLALLRDEGARLLGDDAIAALERLRLEIGNINAAWDHAFATLDFDQLTSSLHPLVRFFQYAGDLDRYATVLSDLVTHLFDLTQSGRRLETKQLSLLSLALASQATVLSFRGEPEAALQAAQEATDIAEELHNKTILANALVNLAGTHFRRSNYVEMRQALDRLEAIWPTVPEGIEKERGLNWRGVWHARMGQSAEAMVWYQAALDLARKLAIRADEPIILLNMGLRHEALNHYAAAEEHMLQSLDLARRTGSWRIQGSTLASLALIDHRFGRHAQGKERLLEVIQLYHSIGNQLRLGQPYTYLGIICLGSDDFSDAAHYLATGRRYYREQGNKSGQVMALLYEGQALSALGKYEAARAAYVEALALAESVAEADSLLWGGALLAELCLQVGDVSQAQQLVARFPAHKDACRDYQIVTHVTTIQAEMSLLQGDLNLAARLAEEAVDHSRGLVPLYHVGALARLGEVQIAREAWDSAETTWRAVLAMRTALLQPVGQLQARVNLARIALAQDQPARAAEHVEAIWPDLVARAVAPGVGIRPLQLFETILAVFKAVSDARATEVRRMAHDWIQLRASGITDDAWRETFLQTHALRATHALRDE